MNLRVPVPSTPGGLALLCWAATLLISAAVYNFLTAMQGGHLAPLQAAATIAGLGAGLGMFYLGHCAMMPKKKRGKAKA